MCREIAFSNCTLKLSEEWVEWKIAPYVKTRAAEQTSLRKKMHEHRLSLSHKAVVKKQLHGRQEDALKSVLANQMK